MSVSQNKPPSPENQPKHYFLINLMSLPHTADAILVLAALLFKLDKGYLIMSSCVSCSFWECVCMEYARVYINLYSSVCVYECKYVCVYMHVEPGASPNGSPLCLLRQGLLMSLTLVRQALFALSLIPTHLMVSEASNSSNTLGTCEML